MSKIWITRPKIDALRFCEELEAARLPGSLTPTLYSLLDVEFLELDIQFFLNSPSVGALVATSRNGVRALSQMKGFEQFTHLPFFTVGTMTGELARSLGFEDVRVGPGRAEGLLPLIREFDQGTEGSGLKRILNLCGDEQAFSIKAAYETGSTLVNSQFEDVLCYQIKEAEELSSGVLCELENNDIQAVVLMSPRTVRVYSSLMKFHDLKQQVSSIQHFCLSEAVADTLKRELDDFKRGFGATFVHVSSFPSQSQMIDCIKMAYSG